MLLLAASDMEYEEDPYLSDDEVGDVDPLYDDTIDEEDDEEEEEDDDLLDDEDDVEMSMDTAEKDDVNVEGSASWTKRRAALQKAAMKGPTRDMSEEDDDPLRSNSPTIEFEITKEPFTKDFLLYGEYETSEMLGRRQDVWMHHLQWVRRNTLLPNVSARIDFEYTILSDDYMAPISQVIGIRANSSDSVIELLKTEPIAAVKGVKEWKVIEHTPIDNDNITQAIRNPHLFIGYSKKDVNDLYPSLLQSQERVFKLGTLKSKDGDGILAVFNAPTLAEANRFIDKSSYSKAKISPINIQDINGLHHFMARSFAAQTVFEQIHFMDPEDILTIELDPIPELPDHEAENKRVLNIFEEFKISFRYTRFDGSNRYGSPIARVRAAQFNSELDTYQQVRLQNLGEMADEILTTDVEEFSSSEE